MRRFLKPIVFGLLIMLAFTACTGDDGADGDVYIAYSWTGSLDDLYTEDPAFGSTVYNGVYERTRPGTYYFQYVHSYAPTTLWYGTYTLRADPGEDGGFMKDGDDGIDLYYELYMWSFGPELTVYDYPASERSPQNKPTNYAAFEAKLKRELALAPEAKPAASVANARKPSFNVTKTATAWEHTQTVRSGGYIITLQYNKVEL